MFRFSLLSDGALFVPFTSHVLKLTHRLKIRYYEDACLAACVLSAACELLVTRNIKDFKASPIKPCLPERAFGILKLS